MQPRVFYNSIAVSRRKEENMENTMTVTLSGGESEAQFSGANAWLRNDGAATIYAAKTAGVTAGAAGVVAIPTGGSAPVYGANGRVFLLGTGSVQLIGSDYSTNPFKTSTASGGSAVDEVARAAVNAHAGNGEIHVTAAEKAAWSAKAEPSDIPTALPANGGNADSVGNIAAAGILRNLGQVTEAAALDDAAFNEYSYEADVSAAVAASLGLSSKWYTIMGFKYSGAGKYGIQLAFPRNHAGQVMFRYADGADWTAWKSLADGGSAASVGAYTEAKLAALEARIAALEGI